MNKTVLFISMMVLFCTTIFAQEGRYNIPRAEMSSKNITAFVVLLVVAVLLWIIIRARKYLASKNNVTNDCTDESNIGENPYNYL